MSPKKKSRFVLPTLGGSTLLVIFAEIDLLIMMVFGEMDSTYAKSALIIGTTLKTKRRNAKWHEVQLLRLV